MAREGLEHTTMSPNNCSDGQSLFKAGDGECPGESSDNDVQIVTSGGLRIPAHAIILASASPVLERIVDRSRKQQGSERTVPILGVPCEAVAVFLQFLYSSECTEEQMEKYGIHLLVLSHVFSVPRLKHKCTRELGERLKIESVVDVLQLSRLCDAPDLYLRCMKLILNNFKAVEYTEGWKFLEDHDPWLELQILQFIDETESRKKKARKNKEEQSLYLQLSEAMECLEHICTEGCINVGPYDMEPTKSKAPCNKFPTCHGLQLLIRHFSTCRKRINGECSRCKRFWQLLRLHSSMCDQPELCKVPLCRQFKLKMQQETKGENARWRLLVRKVVLARAISSSCAPKTKREDVARESVSHGGIGSFGLQKN